MRGWCWCRIIGHDWHHPEWVGFYTTVCVRRCCRGAIQGTSYPDGRGES